MSLKIRAKFGTGLIHSMSETALLHWVAPARLDGKMVLPRP